MHFCHMSLRIIGHRVCMFVAYSFERSDTHLGFRVETSSYVSQRTFFSHRHQSFQNKLSLVSMFFF